VVVAVNEEFTRMTGYTREEVVGHTLDEFKFGADDQGANSTPTA
jgi:PAS domain S-box-containing protein